jgi:hypothetical protein
VNIFLSCQQSVRAHPVPAYHFWESYFKRGIEETGHQWCEAANVDWSEGLVYADKCSLELWHAHTWERTLDQIKELHRRTPIDLFLSYLFPKQVNVNAINEIRRLGIPCVNFFCDNVREFTCVPECFKVFDLHWVPEFKALALYRKARLAYLHAPMPMWTPLEHRVWDHPETYGVSFIGSRDILREELLARVIKLGVGLEIRGAGWEPERIGGSLNPLGSKGLLKTLSNQAAFLKDNGFKTWRNKLYAKAHRRPDSNLFVGVVRRRPDAAEYIEVTQKSVVTLGVNRYPSFRHKLSSPDTYSRLRDIEAPMLGACYLTEWTEGLDQLYELGDEIETYCTAEEMVWKIEELKANSARRRELRRKGQRRAFADHSIGKSLSKIASALRISCESPLSLLHS